MYTAVVLHKMGSEVLPTVGGIQTTTPEGKYERLPFEISQSLEL